MQHAGMAEQKAHDHFVYRDQAIKKLLMLYPKNQKSGLITKKKEMRLTQSTQHPHKSLRSFID